MDKIPDNHALDRLLDSLTRFNPQPDEQEQERAEQARALDIELEDVLHEELSPDDALNVTLGDELGDALGDEPGTAFDDPLDAALDILPEDADNIPNRTDALVSRVDALMHRQNADLVQTNTSSFANLDASAAITTLNPLDLSFELPPPTPQPPQAPHPAPPHDDFDDLPVLTDIVPATQSKAMEGLNVSDAPFTLPAAFDDEALAQDIEHLREDILNSLRKRLDAEIPSLVEATLQSVLPDIVQEIRQGLEDNVHAALNDLLKPR
jgi:hypothetical protein